MSFLNHLFKTLLSLQTFKIYIYILVRFKKTSLYIEKKKYENKKFHNICPRSVRDFYEDRDRLLELEDSSYLVSMW